MENLKYILNEREWYDEPPTYLSLNNYQHSVSIFYWRVLKSVIVYPDISSSFNLSLLILF